MMKTEQLIDIVVNALEDRKAQDILVIDVRGKTSVTDAMIIASGTSSRQVKAAADNVLEQSKKHGVHAIGTEGEREAEWILVDLGDVVVHVMQPAVRAFYQLEKLWSTEYTPNAEAGAQSN